MTELTRLPPSENVLGTPISLTTYEEVLTLLRKPSTDRARVVAVCNVHSVMTARRDSELRSALQAADIRTPDGVPLVWVMRSHGFEGQTRVNGPDLMEMGLAAPGLRHFLYGSTTETLDRMRSEIGRRFPVAEVVGTLAPPFGPITDDDLHKHATSISQSTADVVWIGLGMPKQELLMPRLAPLLPGTTLLGVGAAFDVIAGNVSRAPEILQRAGLEWLYRLQQEPRRLWRRYVLNNPGFLVLWIVDLIRRAVPIRS